VIPGKFIAFSGPMARRREISSLQGKYTLLPEEYVPLFKRLGVTLVVRFNSKCYNRNVFLEKGIQHVDLYYEDGGNPTEEILQKFLKLAEKTKGAIAVHCKAGLGRTGTNIAAYMIKHYGYTAKESIAWCRICRPGSVVGPQQQYLAAHEAKLVKESHIYYQVKAKAELHKRQEQTLQNQMRMFQSNQQSNNSPTLLKIINEQRPNTSAERIISGSASSLRLSTQQIKQDAQRKYLPQQYQEQLKQQQQQQQQQQ
jgi:cell division cycle 14